MDNVHQERRIKVKTRLLLLAALFISFLFGMIVGKAFFSKKVIIGKTSPEWAFLDPCQLARAKKAALKGDSDALMAVLRFCELSLNDNRQAYFWARVGEKNGDSSGESIIRDFNEKYKDSIKESVPLEQHFLDGGLSDDMRKSFEASEPLEVNSPD